MYKYLFLSFFALFLFCGCTEATIEEIFEEEKQESGNLSYMVEGHVRVKVTEPFSSHLSNQADTKGHITTTNVKSSDNILSSIGIKYMVRTFSPAGRFEARMRKAGLHLWYDVYFDVKTPLTKAKLELSDMEGIQMVEYRPQIIRIKSNVVKVAGADRGASNIKRSSTTPHFNDPRLNEQWHYSNDGSRANSVAGSDINVVPAWEKYTQGDPRVIVSIVDGGIDLDHEDLSANVWRNEQEINGVDGVDDDENGFTDDKYGWDFVNGSPTITADDHGTHVAGTISAVNNNGIGVCGIAGGDHKASLLGAKVMSCQIFIGETGGNGAAAIVYGANNGAVISQNSWGYAESDGETPDSDKEAIDYFINSAGVDEHGNQEGPMQGGIVIFAAGNEDSQTLGSAPGKYEPVFAVASIGADYKRAYYSNYGDWVDITATGGDVYRDNQILSTIVDGYDVMQGTSMACPHVSGLAALIVSKHTELGLTPNKLREIIETSSRNIDANNPSHKGKLGKGLIDASTALSYFSLIPPNPVKLDKFDIDVTSNNLALNWEVPIDTDDGNAWGVNVYYSTTSFTSSLDRDNLPGNTHLIKFTADDLSAGEMQQDVIRGLEFNTLYYLAVDAYDFAGNKSALSAILNTTTQANNAPVILPAENIEITLKAFESISKKITYSDPDGHAVTWKLEPGSTAATAVADQENPGEVYVVINALKEKDNPGAYTAKLTVTDSYGLSSEKLIHYTIKPNNSPIVIAEFSNLILGKLDETYTYDLSTYIKDDDGEPLKYNMSSTEIARISENKNVLSITPLAYGITDVTLTATDAAGASCSASFKILIRDEKNEIDLYPNPVIDKLNLRAGKEVNANVLIIGSSGATVHSGSYLISPFAPAQVDMSKLSAGRYIVILKYDDQEIRKNIVKL